VAHAGTQRPLAHVPGLIRFPGPVLRTLLRAGVPVGPNMLVTVRGRSSGLPRTQALAIAAHEGHRYVIGTFGDVNWCRNMRANAEIEIRRGRHVERARAVELTPAAAAKFFADSLPASVADMNAFGKLASRFLLWYAAPDIKTDPAAAAMRRPVFEILPV
jgi:deazaflavin-dependent oxidoreductase (nitroreductase family)